MMKFDLRYKVVKDLILEYQQTQSSVVFNKILKRMDRLLMYQSNYWKRNLSFLSSVSLEDVYQTSIIGLYKAIEKMKPDQPPKYLHRHISAYVRYCLSIKYRHQNTVKRNKIKIKENIVTEEEVYHEVEKKIDREYIFTLLQELRQEGKVSLKDIKLWCLRRDGHTFAKIAKLSNCNPRVAQRNTAKVTELLAEKVRSR